MSRISQNEHLVRAPAAQPGASLRRGLAARLGVWLRRDALALLAFILAALLILAPILSDPSAHVIGHEGDQVAYIYMAGWMAEALRTGQNPFVDPRLGGAEGLSLASTELPYLPLMLVAPVTALGGPTRGYTLVLFLSHVLSGYCAYLWVRSVTRSRVGGVVAGLSFMLAPFHIARSFGHLTLVSTYPLPLFFWALDRALVGPREIIGAHTEHDVPNGTNVANANRERTLKYAPMRWETPQRGAFTRRGPGLWSLVALLGATLLVAGVSQYLTLICLLLGIVYGLVALRERPAFLLVHGWRVAIAVLIGVLVGMLPALLVLSHGGFAAWDIQATRVWSASPVNFFAPSPFHPLWGEWIARARPETLWIEKALYLGIVALALAVVALLQPWLAAARGRGARREVVACRASSCSLAVLCRTWGAVALIAAIFALGTDLHFGNVPASRDHPLWLPMYYLGQLPVVSFARTWSRFGVITVLFVALLAGVGTAYLARGPRRGWVGPALMVLVVVDLLPGRLPTTTIAPRPIDHWLAAQPGTFSVGFLPVTHGLPSYRVAYGSLLHQKWTYAAMHDQHHSAAFDAFARRARTFPAEDSISDLCDLGLRYLVLERPLYGAGWPTIERIVRASPRLQVVADRGDTLVVELVRCR